MRHENEHEHEHEDEIDDEEEHQQEHEKEHEHEHEHEQAGARRGLAGPAGQARRGPVAVGDWLARVDIAQMRPDTIVVQFGPAQGTLGPCGVVADGVPAPPAVHALGRRLRVSRGAPRPARGEARNGVLARVRRRHISNKACSTTSNWDLHV